MIEKEYYNNGKLKFEYEIKNDEKEGFFREYYENGQLKKESCYKNGKLNALCKQYYENGQLELEYTLNEGKIHGLCKKYYENGQLEFEYNIKEDKKEGLCKEYYENGQLKSEYNCKENKVHGLYKDYYEDGHLKYEANYKEGNLEGLYKQYYKSGQLEFEETYKEGKLNGFCKSYYKNGQLEIESTLKEGKPHGLFKKYYENGQLKLECNYKEKKKDGLCKEYYENGHLKFEGNFKEDRKEGFCKSYYENSQLKFKGNFKDDKEDGLCKEYSEDGQLKFEYNHKDGKKDGLCKEYSEDGQLKCESNFKNGELEGLFKIYYENGQLKTESILKEGKIYGLFKEYNKNSQLIFEDYYENNKRYFGKTYKYSIENNQEMTKINYYICDVNDNKIIYQEDYENTSLNLIIRKNYLVLNGERIRISKKIISDMKELQNINDNIKLKANNRYINLDRNHYKNICSYKDIIAEIEVFNKDIFFEREFIKDGVLNGLKVLYKKNKETNQYIKIELYEKNIQIKDNIDDRRRLINQYLISNEEKEEWINIPFIEEPNYTSKNSNENIENLEASNNKALYIILPIIGVLVFGIILYFVFFKENNDYQEVSTQSTTSYSQAQPQQAVATQSVVENNTERQEVAQQNNIQTTSNYDYDLGVLEKVYDEVINRGNESYLENFSSEELSIIRNTLYARKGYQFKKKEYQEYFGQKSWYNPTTTNQNILTKDEERLANIIKGYENNANTRTSNTAGIGYENKFGRVVNDKYVGGSFIDFLRNADQNEYYYLRDQFWEILDTMYVTEDNKTYYYLNDIIDQLETKADWDNSSRVISLEVKGNKMYYTVGFPKGYNANTPSWVQFEIFERKFNDGI